MAGLFQRIVLVGLVAFLGLFAGIVVGSAFFVPDGSGLAGLAIALAYGVGGAMIALAVGVMLALRLGPRARHRALIVAAALAAAIVAWIPTSPYDHRRRSKG